GGTVPRGAHVDDLAARGRRLLLVALPLLAPGAGALLEARLAGVRPIGVQLRRRLVDSVVVQHPDRPIPVRGLLDLVLDAAGIEILAESAGGLFAGKGACLSHGGLEVAAPEVVT